MSDKKEYISIDRFMTLNNWKDGAADTRENREFQILKNYIPGRGEIRTREGITCFAHTPAGTGGGPPDPWDPTNSPEYTISAETATCRLILRFESLATIGQNAIDLTTPFSPLQSVAYDATADVQSGSVYKEGVNSILMTQNTALQTSCGTSNEKVYGLRTNTANYPSYMPGDTADSTNVCMVTYWVYPLNVGPAAAAEWHCTFGNAQVAGSKGALGVRHFDDDLEGYYGIDGVAWNQEIIPAIMVQDRWQYVAFWADGVNGHWGLYHYDDVTKVETWTANDTLAFANFYTHSSNATINGKTQADGVGGTYSDTSDAFNGYMDYFTLWDSLFVTKSSNITLVRALRDLHKSMV